MTERKRNARGHFIKDTKSRKKSSTYLTLTPPTKKNDGNKVYKYDSIIYIDLEVMANRQPTNEMLSNAIYQLEEFLKRVKLKNGWKVIDPSVSWLYEQKEIKKGDK